MRRSSRRLKRDLLHPDVLDAAVQKAVDNLKTLFYAEVMRRMTGLEVTAAELTSRREGLPVFKPLVLGP